MLTSSYPLRPGSASGAFVAEMARHLVLAGHSVQVVVPADAEGAPGPSGDVGIRLAHYARPRRLQRLFHGAGLPENLRQTPALAVLAPLALASLGAVTRDAVRQADVVLSHWLLPSGVLGAWVARATGLPHVAVAHSGDVTLAARLLPLPARRALAAHLRRGARRLVFTHAGLLAAYREALGPHPDARVCPMGVELPTRLPPAVRRPPGAPLRLLFVGRLEPIKGAATLLAALAASPGLRLTLAGDGSQRELLAREAAWCGERVRLLGHVPREHVRSLFAEHDVLVVPSHVTALGRTEGVPHALLEAQAHGLPVVASAVGGIPEVVDDGRTGLLVPPGDAPALAAALRRLDGDRDEVSRLGRAAAEHARRYAWPRTLANMLEGLVPCA